MKRIKPADCYVGKESSFQSSAVKVIRLMTPKDTLICHIPNGRNAGSIAMGGFWKNQGVVSGMPDLMVFAEEDIKALSKREGFGDRKCGLALELKIYPNKTSEAQDKVHDILRKAGWHVEVAYGLSHVEKAVKTYFGL